MHSLRIPPAVGAGKEALLLDESCCLNADADAGN